jgi:hypothetical protein
MVAPADRRERSTILRGPGKADPAQLLRGHLAVHNPLQVVAIVCAQDFLVGRCVRLARHSLACQSGLLNALAQKPVLRHRKSVSRRQRQHVVVSVEDFHCVKRVKA